MTARPVTPQVDRAALEAFTKSPSYQAYARLIGHYEHCAGCAHDTDPCPEGTALRQAWKAVRWT